MKVTTSPNSIKAIHSNPISASNGKILYISSVCLQTLWLLSIWLTGTVDSVDKLFPLLLYTLCIGFILYFRSG
jgi:hypothetical protein